jgi:hypothetical protein
MKMNLALLVFPAVPIPNILQISFRDFAYRIVFDTYLLLIQIYCDCEIWTLEKRDIRRIKDRTSEINEMHSRIQFMRP